MILTHEESESAIIGCILIDEECAYDIFSILSENDFFSHTKKFIFLTIKKMLEEKKKIDIVTVCGEISFDRNAVLEVTNCVQLVTSTSMYRDYCNTIKDHSNKRSIRKLIDQIEKDINKKNSEELLEDISSFLIEKLEKKEKKKSLKDVASSILSKILDSGKEKKYILTGFRSLDSVLYGFSPGQVFIIAARPSMGKTAFATQLLLNITRKNTPSLFLSLEMHQEEIVERMIANIGNIFLSKIKNENLSENDFLNLGIAIDVLNTIPLFIENEKIDNIYKIQQKIRYYKQKHNIQVVCIDYIQLVNSTKKKYQNRNEEIEYIVKIIKTIAIELEITIIILSQLSRAVDTRANRRPMLSDLRDSGSIEQVADVVLMLFRNDYYEKGEKNNILEVDIAKQRNGETKTIALKTMFEVQRVEEL